VENVRNGMPVGAFNIAAKHAGEFHPVTVSQSGTQSWNMSR